MTAIRPPIFPAQPPPTGAGRADQTKSAAQKAFFDLAMGSPAPPAASVAQPSVAAGAPATLQRIPDAATEKPQKILRPGSLLDIRI